MLTVDIPVDIYYMMETVLPQMLDIIKADMEDEIRYITEENGYNDMTPADRSRIINENQITIAACDRIERYVKP